MLEVEDATFEQPPETLSGVARELIRGVYKLKDALLLVLDTEKAVNVSGGRDGAAKTDPRSRCTLDRSRALNLAIPLR